MIYYIMIFSNVLFNEQSHHMLQKKHFNAVAWERVAQKKEIKNLFSCISLVAFI